MSDEFPKSKQLAAIKTKSGKHIVTAASWDAFGHGESYEIGIRCFAGGKPAFKLIQAAWDEDTVQLAAQCIAQLLDAGHYPDDIARIFP